MMFGRRGEKTKRGMNKKGMEMEEVIKIGLAVLVLLLLGLGVWLLLKGKGGDILGAIKRLLRFGG